MAIMRRIQIDFDTIYSEYIIVGISYYYSIPYN